MLISVKEAEQRIVAQKKDYGTETLPFLEGQGRVLAENIHADRDLPPYNRSTMDGIAIAYADYESGCRSFPIAGVQAAGELPMESLPPGACVEIMTGAALSTLLDTVIPYEQLKIENGRAEIGDFIVKKGRYVHLRASDCKQGDLVLESGCIIGAAEINMLASVGKAEVAVRKLPRALVISTGDELVDVMESPLPHQIRRSNVYTMEAFLHGFGISAQRLHLPDDPDTIRRELRRCLAEFDLIMCSGGISMGKFDHLPEILEELGVEKQFHKVRQRPGKPFWFGTFGAKCVVFGMPGNPVSTFVCLLKYAKLWLEASLGGIPKKPLMAALAQPYRFEPALHFFLPVKLEQDEQAKHWAWPIETQGSGDFTTLLQADAFLELPEDQTDFGKGLVFKTLAH